MVAKFWDAVGGKLADRWLATAIPALVFWAGGVLAWALGTAHVDTIRARLDDLAAAATGTQLIVLGGGLILVTVSALVVDRLTLPVTRVLEGYWPAWADPVRRELLRQRGLTFDRDEKEWQRIAAKIEVGTASPEERRRYVETDLRRARTPTNERRMPMRLGDILRAAETRPIDKYGLDAVTCWPRFWLVLPDSTRTQLNDARSSMDSGVAACIWSVLAITFAPWWPWALVVGPILAGIVYTSWVCPRAEVFADLVESSFDVHRTALYAALRWPLPATPAAERTAGEAITRYLLRGSDAAEPYFTTPGTS